MAPNWIIRFLALAFGACAAAFAQPVDHPYGRSQPIAGRYIVVFKDHVNNPAAEAASLARGLGAQLHFTYTSAIKGFAATLPDAAAQALRNNPNVDYVEPDQTVSLNGTQPGATWGLDRIDQGSSSLDGFYHYNSTGMGVNAFIIDTGIRSTHNDFGGRIVVNEITSDPLDGTADGFTAIKDQNGTNDCNGHGTHVAGTVGGATWGVAKAVTLIPVRVLDCNGSGTWSGVIAGIDWVAKKKESSPTPFPAVANMSLGGGASSSVDKAVAGAVAKGVTMVVAAGNSDSDACNYSPARAPGAITVGATTSSDKRAIWFPTGGSNWGTCVDIFAPGNSITSAWNSRDDAINTISGTSMASPHVAGVAALALAAGPAASPAAVAAFLTDGATPGALTDVRTSPNLLVYSMAGSSPTDPTVHVHSLAGSSGKAGKNWKAYADVTIDRSTSGGTANIKAAPNATVTGSFDPGGTASCITNNTGKCRLSSATIENKFPSTSFKVENVSGSVLIYDSNANHNGTQIPISKP